MTEQEFCDIQKKLHEDFFKEHGYSPVFSVEDWNDFYAGTYKVLDVVLWNRTDGGGQG